MPDDVIVHILSYLPILDAVRTILIRPFGTLWTLVPTLHFDVEKVDLSRFFIFVRNVLKLHRRPFIDEFCLSLVYQPDDQRSECGDDIKMCLKFALDKQAKVIVFHDRNEEFTKSSDYPNFVSQSLVSLELHWCAIFPELLVDLGSLKVLKLDFVKMSEVTFQQFICGCPSLQVLHIYQPICIRNRSFSAPNIHTLFLEFEEYGPEDDDRWLFNFPNLQSLDLELYRIPDVIEIDVSSVRDVYIREFRFEIDDENKLGMFKLFLEKFSQSNVFRLSDSAAEPFLHLLDDLHLLQIRWKRVVLPLPIMCEICVLGVYHLIRSSKDLEELDIHTHTISTTSSVRNTTSLLSGELLYPCVMPKLRTVTLHGYAKPWECQLQLVEFLLKSATVLEKLVIVPNKCGLTAVEKQEFVLHVSRFQKTSPRARVLFP